MFSKEGKVLDLGSYRRFTFEECIQEKFNTFVLDEGGLSSPLSISLVIPTKFEPEGILEIEETTLHRILAECSELVDAGYLDEIIIMGATRDENGEPDFTILEKTVKIAYEELGLFREQVDLLNKYRSQKERAKRGLIDFFLKVIHQFDPNITKLLAKYGVFGVTGYFGVLPGKGSGLWLSVPLTRGDILCFVDADIMNFQKEFITGLCHPIIYSWNIQEAAIKLVKAYYTRLTVTKTDPQKVFLGGRICRLLAMPLLRSIVETFKLYLGLENMKYPLAGEFAVSRDTMEQLNFPNTYAIETSLLFQTYDLIGPASIAQLDLDIYRHIGQRFERLENMAYQIVDFVFRLIDEKLGRPLTREEKEQLIVSYEENVTRLIDDYEKAASQIKEIEKNLLYSREDDLEKKKRLQQVIFEVLEGKSKEKRPRYFSYPSWRRISERTRNYFVLKEMLRRRCNQSTWSRLKECGLLS
ncbi:MAG TPA: hypothetical protein ENG19_03415 [Candidatus Bathyarchaeota archaeon]|nr:hypothetical protein [Candidatus Bathyarchaeota archaeon]